jgi:hypothetical protein
MATGAGTVIGAIVTTGAIIAGMDGTVITTGIGGTIITAGTTGTTVITATGDGRRAGTSQVSGGVFDSKGNSGRRASARVSINHPPRVESGARSGVA